MATLPQHNTTPQTSEKERSNDKKKISTCLSAETDSLRNLIRNVQKTIQDTVTEKKKTRKIKEIQ
jgi:hypothetical protein